MHLARFEKLDAARRARIIRTAALEFAQHGFSGASLNRILKQAGLSKGAMYYYFADKDDLYRSTLSLLLDDLLALMEPTRHIDSPADYWSEWLDMYAQLIRHLTREPVAVTLLWDAIRSRARRSAHPALSELAERIRERIRTLLLIGRELGAVRSDIPEELLLHVCFGLLEGVDRWFADEWQTGNPIAPERLATTAIDLLRRVAGARRDDGGLP